uniref:Uncharacterized protein n=1 Tax=Avena sativa TaxID=4498 RepID=A0ACD5X8Q4_AVESA
MDGGAMELVSTVGQLVGEEYRQLRGVGGQIAELRDELATMNAILRMQSEAEEGSVDHFVREWMKQVRELAYDAEDCVHLYIFRVRCRPRDGFVTWSKRLLATVFSCRRLAGEIEALRARAVAISERHARYGLSRDALCRSPSLAPVPASGWSAQALRTADDLDEFVGIRSQAEILTKLIDAEEGDKKLKVFSVVGFRGLGKTTLAMVLCRQLEAKFQRQAQVSVSQAFDGRNDLKGLLTRVLEQIVKPKASDGKGIIKEENPLDGVDRMTEDKLAGKIKEVLNGMSNHASLQDHHLDECERFPEDAEVHTIVMVSYNMTVAADAVAEHDYTLEVVADTEDVTVAEAACEAEVSQVEEVVA